MNVKHIKLLALLLGGILVVLIITMVLTAKKAAAQDDEVPDINELKALYSADSPILSRKAAKAFRLSTEHAERTPLMKAGEMGKVVVLYGDGEPVLVCKMLDWCEIQMQPGEQVRKTLLSNDVLWKTDASISGTGNNAITHILVRPEDVDIQARIRIFTDRRTYNIVLHSTANESISVMAFEYQDDVNNKFAQLYASMNKPKRNAPRVRMNMESTNHSYTWEGDAPFRPTSVYNDGERTMIVFNKEVAAGELPIFLVEGKGGKPQIVNYRIVPGCDPSESEQCNENTQAPRFVVDTVVRKGFLQTGNKRRNRNKVIITYTGDTKPPVKTIAKTDK